MPPLFIRLNDADNVVIARATLPPGTVVDGDVTVAIRSVLPFPSGIVTVAADSPEQANERMGAAVAIDGAYVTAGFPGRGNGAGAVQIHRRDAIFHDGFDDTAPE